MDHVLETYARIKLALGARTDAKGPYNVETESLYEFAPSARSTLAALLTIAVVIREGRHE